MGSHPSHRATFGSPAWGRPAAFPAGIPELLGVCSLEEVSRKTWICCRYPKTAKMCCYSCYRLFSMIIIITFCLWGLASTNRCRALDKRGGSGETWVRSPRPRSAKGNLLRISSMAETGWVPSRHSRILGSVFPGGRIQQKMDMLRRGARIQNRLKSYF